MSGAILGVDYGSVRIGIAVCERLDLPAMPLTTIAHKNRVEDIACIVKLAEERGAGTIVVGYPLRLDGSRGPAAQNVDRFVHELDAAFSGSVVTIDERLTSAAAAKKMDETSLNPSRKRRLLDQLAAVEIAESYRAQLNSRF